MKYFVFGDAHGCYEALINSLNEAGYEISNPNHCLIGLGDYFDRGYKSKEIMEFLQSVPQKVLLLGNHEFYLLDMMRRGYISQGDIYNGVLATFLSFTGINENEVCIHPDVALDALTKTELRNFIRNLQFAFKTKDYLFIHASIPETVPFEQASWQELLAAIQTSIEEEFKKPISKSLEGLAKTNRKLVVGHRHTFLLRKEIYDDGKEKHSIWEYKNVIALDACTILTEKVNIFTFEDEPLSILLKKQE